MVTAFVLCVHVYIHAWIYFEGLNLEAQVEMHATYEEYNQLKHCQSMYERDTNKTAHPEESSKESTSKFKCKKCWDSNRIIICDHNALSICEKYHPKTCKKEAIEKHHLQVVKETASPREYHH